MNLIPKDTAIDALSSGFYGQPRAANDADIIIAPKQARLVKFLKSLEDGYYVSPEAAFEAMKLRGEL